MFGLGHGAIGVVKAAAAVDLIDGALISADFEYTLGHPFLALLPFIQGCAGGSASAPCFSRAFAIQVGAFVIISHPPFWSLGGGDKACLWIDHAKSVGRYVEIIVTKVFAFLRQDEIACSVWAGGHCLVKLSRTKTIIKISKGTFNKRLSFGSFSLLVHSLHLSLLIDFHKPNDVVLMEVSAVSAPGRIADLPVGGVVVQGLTIAARAFGSLRASPPLASFCSSCSCSGEAKTSTRPRAGLKPPGLLK